VFDRLKAACPRVADRIAHRWFRARYRLARLSRAWAYLRDHLDADAAQRVMLDCEYSAGWHPLLVLTVEDTLEQAHEIFADHPDLPRLINDGCARVASKWESYDDELYGARRCAIDLAADYAVAEGVVLTRLEADGDHAASDTTGDDHTAVSKDGSAP